MHAGTPTWWLGHANFYSHLRDSLSLYWTVVPQPNTDWFLVWSARTVHPFYYNRKSWSIILCLIEKLEQVSWPKYTESCLDMSTYYRLEIPTLPRVLSSWYMSTGSMSTGSFRSGIRTRTCATWANLMYSTDLSYTQSTSNSQSSGKGS